MNIENAQARLRAYMIHIGLAHLAYNAWTGKLDELASVTERLLPLLDEG